MPQTSMILSDGSADREWTVTKWAPHLVGWVIAAMMAFALFQAKVAVLERNDDEHDRRLLAIEIGQAGAARELSNVREVMARVEVLLNEIREERAQQRRRLAQQ